jgi:hypothetical protein
MNLTGIAWTQSGGTLNVAGAINVSGASWAMTGGTLTVSGGMSVAGGVVQTAGVIILSGGNLTAMGPGLQVLGSGILSGSGIVTAALTNGATVSPGASLGAISVSGPYTQTASGHLVIEVQGISVGSFDRLLASGALSLAGSVDVTTSGFMPVPGNTFQFISGSSRIGTLLLTGADAGPGLVYTVVHSSTGASLVVQRATVPSAPKSPTASAGTKRATVSWLPPDTDGGSPITGYEVTSDVGGKTCSTTGDLTCTVMDLNDDQPYRFRVRAINAVDPGDWSVWSNSVTTRATLISCTPGSFDPPTDLWLGATVGCSATPGTGAEFMGWASLGFNPVSSQTHARTFTATTPGLAGVFGLYTDDLGQHQTVFNYIIHEPTVPSAPHDVVAQAGDGTAKVSWSPPDDDGGSPITRYEVTSHPGGNTCIPSPATVTTCMVTGLENGTPYSFTVAASNAIGTSPDSDPSEEVWPGIPPTAWIKSLSTYSTTTTLDLTWGADPGTYDVASYDVRYRRASWMGGFGSLILWKDHVTETDGTLGVSKGYTYCFSARARDVEGIVSAWTAESCTAVPLDDRSLTRSSGWAARTGSAYYAGTYLKTKSTGAKLTRTKIVAKRIALVATTCPTCGKVKVYWNGTLLKTVSLASSTTTNRKVITIRNWSSVKSGKLVIKVVSSGRKVVIDGVAISRV